VPDRIASDHASVDTHRASIERRGRTDRPRVDLAAVPDLPTDSVVRLSLGGTVRHALIEASFDGTPGISGAYDNARLARAPGEGTDRLGEWQTTNGLQFGRSVCFDVVVPGHAYGLRIPGERAVYSITEPPTDSLRSIARSLDGEQ
jgi:hypothetical protein